MQLDEQYWKVQRGLSVDFWKKKKEFPCKIQITQNIIVADNERESLFVIW